MNMLIVIGIAAGAVIIALMGIMAAIKKFRKIPKADEALVRTGGKEPVVSTGGSLWVVPMFHELARVSLQSVRVPIDRTGGDSVPTKDMIPAEIKGEMFVQVNPQDAKAIVLAVQSLGTCDPDEMSEVVQEKINSQITDALRTAAFKKTFLELNSQKREFADEVTQLLQEDLAKLGLTLATVAVTHISQGSFSKDEGDVIASQGRRNVAETVQRNRQETNLINQQATIAIKQQNVEATQQALALDLTQRQKEADQSRQVKEYEATQAAAAKKMVLSQLQIEAEALAAQERAIAEAKAQESEKAAKAEIVKLEQIAIRQAQADSAQKSEQEKAATAIAQALSNRKVAEADATRKQEEAEVARQKAVELARIAKEQALKVAEEGRQQAAEQAEVARQVAVATSRTQESLARAKQAEAEAAKRTAEESVITVKSVAEANRQKGIVVIKAEEDASKDKITADKNAYINAKNAEGEKDAILMRAEAAKGKAIGEADAVRATAEGYAADQTIRAKADFEAADQKASARTKLAEATLREGQAAAESHRLMVQAQNGVGKNLLLRDVAVELLRQAPAIVHEVMFPVSQVTHDVKVLQVNGLGGNGNGGESTTQTILGTGMALTGALPLIREGLTAFLQSEDVKGIAGELSGVVRNALKETAGGLTAGVAGGLAGATEAASATPTRTAKKSKD